MKFTTALSKLINQVHDRRTASHTAIPGYEDPDPRDLIAASDVNIRLAVDVFGERGLLDEFYGEEDQLDFGTFDNLREYGLTVAVGGWTFAVFEHRNSDQIVIEGCPTAQVADYGPYGGEDKWDSLFVTNYKTEHAAAKAIVVAARRVLAHPEATRADLKYAMSAAQVAA